MWWWIHYRIHLEVLSEVVVVVVHVMEGPWWVCSGGGGGRKLLGVGAFVVATRVGCAGLWRFFGGLVWSFGSCKFGSGCWLVPFGM